MEVPSSEPRLLGDTVVHSQQSNDTGTNIRINTGRYHNNIVKGAVWPKL